MFNKREAFFLESCAQVLGHRWLRTVFASGLLLLLLLLPLMLLAATVQSLSVLPKDKEDVLHIQADAPLQYETMNLSNPNRFILKIAGAALAEGLASMQKVSARIQSIDVRSVSSGVFLQLNVTQHAQYRIEEVADGLLVHIPHLPSRQTKALADIQSIQVDDVASGSDVRIQGMGLGSNYNAFLTHDRRQLVVDFWNARTDLSSEPQLFEKHFVQSIVLGSAEGRLRLMIQLNDAGRDSAYQIIAKDKVFKVHFYRQVAERLEPSVREEQLLRVEDVSFSSVGQAGLVQISFNQADPKVKVIESEHAFEWLIQGARLAKGQQRTLDVKEFSTALTSIDVFQRQDDVHILVHVKPQTEAQTFQQGKVLKCRLNRKASLPTTAASMFSKSKSYTGELVSFDFKSMDLQNALMLFAEMSDLNVVMSDDVSGSISLHLKDVPWDQALDLILASKGLGKVLTGKIMRIAPLERLREERLALLKSARSSERLEPLTMVYLTLNFAKAGEVAAMIKKVSSGVVKPVSGLPLSIDKDSGGLLSRRGSIGFDERTNTLIVRDTAASIKAIRAMMKRIDQPIRQVMIQARIVEASNTFTREFGVRWGGSFSRTGNRVISLAGPNQTGGVGANPAGPLLDLPAAIGAGLGGGVGLSIGSLAGNVLQLELSAAEADDKIKVVSSPRLVTTNMKTAVIYQGSDIPFQSSSANSGVNIQFRKATLGLEVTPQITPNRHVLLHVVATKDSPSASSVGGNPIIDTKKVDTEVEVRDGETIVIGGVFQKKETKVNSGVPLLMNLPVLGHLFKHQGKAESKTELLIFITPTILSADERYQEQP